MGAVGDDHARVREGATELVGRALASRRRHAQFGRRAVTAGPGVGAATAPGADGRRAGTGRPKGTGAVRAARGSTAVGAHERGGVPRAGDLHQDGTALQRLARGGERRRGHARLPLLALACGAQDHTGARPPRLRNVADVPDVDQALHVGRPRVSREEQGGALDLLAHERGVARVHARGEGLGEQGVAVVPDRDETGVVCGRRHPIGVRRRCRAPARGCAGTGRSARDRTGRSRRARWHPGSRARPVRRGAVPGRGSREPRGRRCARGRGCARRRRREDRPTHRVGARDAGGEGRRGRSAPPRRGRPRDPRRGRAGRRPVRTPPGRPRAPWARGPRPRPSRRAPCVWGPPGAARRSPTPRPDQRRGARGRRGVRAARAWERRPPRPPTADVRCRHRARPR